MIQFNQPIKDYKDYVPNTGSYNKPTKDGGYVLKCLKSSIEKSTKGNDCWVMHFDIGEGQFVGAFSKYPLRSYQAINNDVGKRIAGQLVKAFISSNPGMISPSVGDVNAFDESNVVGLLIGAVLKKNDKGYFRIESLCDVNVARNMNVPF